MAIRFANAQKAADLIVSFIPQQQRWNSSVLDERPGFLKRPALRLRRRPELWHATV
jgi:hypothetical protein